MTNDPRLDNSTKVDDNTYFGNTVNAETQQVVEEITPNTPIEAETPQKANILKINDKGEKVLELQKQLLQLNFLSGGIHSGADGIYGLSTRDAVRDFQQSVGIEADGIVGPQTWAMLQELVEKPFAKFDSPVFGIAISPNGRSVVAALENGNLELRPLREGDIAKKTFQGHKVPIRCVSFSPDGQILASGSDDHTIKLWNVATENKIHTLTGHEDLVWSVSFSPDGQTLASSSQDKTIKLWKVETGEELFTFRGHEGLVWSVSFSSDGQTLASSSQDKTIKLWKVETGKELFTLTGHEGPILSVNFSPDGQTLASGSDDHTIRLWDVITGTGKELITLMGHEKTVYSVSFSPDGQILASGSGEETIKLWNVGTGQELLTLTGHEGAIWNVNFSPDGQTLGSSSEDRTIRLWDVKTGKQLSGLSMLPIKISIGQELQNDLPQRNDQLNIKTEIDALTNVLMLRELKPPLAVGILGGWGSGKSFALHLMKQRINEIRSEALTEKQAWGEGYQLFPYVGHIYQIEFDAWTYAKSNLWASLMQKVFFELNRQISLEEKLKTAGVDLLKGGQIWKALNNMSDEQRRQILDSNLTQDIFKETKSHDTWQNIESKGIASVLWDTLGKLRQQEVEKLREEQQSLLNKENDLREKEIQIEKQVDQKIREKSRALLWNPLKDELSEQMGITVAQLESKLTDKDDSEKVQITLNELESELEFWKSLWKTCKDNPTILLFFIASLILLIISPWLLNGLSTLPLGGFSDSVARIVQLLTTSPAFIVSVPFIEKGWKGWKKYKKQVKQILERYQIQVIDEQEKLAQSRQTLNEIEKANNQNLTNL
jgi:WD40 repeat protein